MHRSPAVTCGTRHETTITPSVVANVRILHGDLAADTLATEHGLAVAA